MAVYGYARVSTVRQSDQGESLELQQRKIRGYALQYGLEIARVFVERGISGSKPLEDRPQGKILLGALQAGDALVCSKLDRLFRSASDALKTCEQFKERKCSLHLLDLGGDVTANGGGGIPQMVFTILSAVAQFERERIVERLKETKADLKRQGRFLGGSVPFGYRVENKLLVEVPEEQRAVREMRRLRKQGQSLRAIAEKVSEKLNRKIAHGTVKQVLDQSKS